MTPIVLIHGIRLSGACWTQQRRLLEGCGYTVATPDLPGHGSRRDETFTIDGAVAVVAAAIDEAGGRAVLAGHSLGGYVGLATAARHSERVAHLVGVGCTLTPSWPLRSAFGTGARVLGATHDGGAQISARTLRRLLPVEVAEPTIGAGIATESVVDVMAAATAIDPVADLACYRGPVTLINGRHDHFRLGERRFLAAARDGELQIVPGAGHYVPLTHGPDFARALRRIAHGADLN